MTKLKYAFKYLKAGKYKRPLIPIILEYKNKQIPVLSLVDSGADFNVFHADIAPLLGIDITKLSKMNFGGIKVSSAEIERACAGIQEIKDIAAIAITPGGGGPSELVLYIVSKNTND